MLELLPCSGAQAPASLSLLVSHTRARDNPARPYSERVRGMTLMTFRLCQQRPARLDQGSIATRLLHVPVLSHRSIAVAHIQQLSCLLRHPRHPGTRQVAKTQIDAFAFLRPLPEIDERALEEKEAQNRRRRAGNLARQDPDNPVAIARWPSCRYTRRTGDHAGMRGTRPLQRSAARSSRWWQS